MNKDLINKIYEFTKYLEDYPNKKDYYIKEFLPEILDYNFTNLNKEARELFLEIREQTNAAEWNNIIDIIIDVKENYDKIMRAEEQARQENIARINTEILDSIKERDYEKTLFLVKKYTRELMIDEFNFSSSSLVYWSRKVQIIKTFLSRKIQKLLHFTNVDNLESILTYGLQTRENMDKNGIISKISDYDRNDKRLDCTSLSIEYPNYQMLNYKRSCSPESVFCILVFDAHKILLGDTKKYYVNVNAANNNAAWWLEKEVLSESRYFEKMFAENILYKGKEYTRESIKVPFLTTHPQAEILLNGDIPVTDILEIHFANEQNYNHFSSVLKDKSILSKFKFVVSDFYFKNRDDVKWEER